MTISYSKIAQSGSTPSEIISIATPSQSEAGPSSPKPITAPKTNIQHLILDAGPLLSLTPLRHLATSFHTSPLVLSELRDPKARDHWEQLKISGLVVKVEAPRPDILAKVVAFAKLTGDYAVLSPADLSVIALTYQYEAEINGIEGIRTFVGQKLKKDEKKSKAKQVDTMKSTGNQAEEAAVEESLGAEEGTDEDSEEEVENTLEHLSSSPDVDEVTRGIESVLLDTPSSLPPSNGNLESALTVDSPTSGPTLASNSPHKEPPLPSSTAPSNGDADPTPASLLRDEDPESDGEEWITPSNISKHRSKDLGLYDGDDKNATQVPLAAACMTGDYAVQNVLLHMGLGLVGEAGKRISKVKSFVLRCHACFKLCKDSSKRFCPSCGNATLLRTTVSTSASGETKIHLKKNFEYRLRGTKYSIPDPKMGRAKGQSKGGSGLILREDQAEWQEAERKRAVAERKEEKRIAKGGLDGWNDPDWIPEIISVGMSGKGRHGSHGMPAIGHGRRNPNQSRKTKK